MSKQDSLEFNEQIFGEGSNNAIEENIETVNEIAEETIEENNIIPTKKIILENEKLLTENEQLLAEATEAREELALLIEKNKQDELERKEAEEALEEKLAQEAEEALQDLNELVNTDDVNESVPFSAQASDASSTDESVTNDNSNTEYAYIKIGSYKRGNSANSLMNYIYDLMGFDTRFLKYDINVEKFDKNDFSVVIGPVPMTEAKSMLEELDTQLSSENSSIMDAELTCNEEVILMCSI